MKTNLIKLLSLLLTLVLMLPLVFSCGEETPPDASSKPNGESAFDRMSEKEKALHIIDIDYSDTNKRIDVIMELFSVGSERFIHFSTHTYEAETGIGTDDYTNVNFKNTSIDLSYKHTLINSENGYVDGKMFHYQSTNNHCDYREWSKIDRKSYLAYREYLKENNEGLLGDYVLSDKTCRTITCKKDTSGNWVATFTDFTDEGLKPFEAMLEPFVQQRYVDKSTFTGVTVKAKVDANFKPISADIIFNFTSESQTAFKVTATFAYGDDVTIRVPDLSYYTQVDDIRK